MASRLAIISAFWPEYDATAAGLRMHQLIDLFIDQDFEIHYATTAPLNTKHSEVLKNKGLAVHAIELNSDSFDHWVTTLAPDTVLYDRYVVEEQFGWRVVKQLPNAIRILDTEDLHSLRVSRQLAQKEGIDWSIAYWKAQDITKRELASIYRCDLSLIISEKEMDYLQKEFKLPEDLLIYLPFTPEKQSEKQLSFENRKDLVFIGNGMHAPNRDAVEFLKKEIWPIIRKELKGVHLHIYGAYLPTSLLNYHQPNEGFLVHGKADNATEVISKSRINLAALRYGAGVKGKVVEGILSGTPTIATPIAAEGIKGLIPIDAIPQAIAQRAITLYKDNNAWNNEVESYQSIALSLVDTSTYICTFNSRLKELKSQFQHQRDKNYIGQLLNHQSLQSTKYLSKWIEEKNKK